MVTRLHIFLRAVDRAFEVHCQGDLPILQAGIIPGSLASEMA